MKKLKIALAVLILLIAGVLGLALNVSGAFQPRKYLAPWDPTYHEQFKDTRTRLIAHGLLAPSAHNLQSWKIVPIKDNPNGFQLYVDTARLLPQTDPPSRQVTISQGTFLELVSIAGAEMGRKVDIKLFPAGEFDAKGSVESMKKFPVATVTFAADETVKKTGLYKAIFERRTGRVPYLNEPLTPEQIKAFTALNDSSALELKIIQEEKPRDSLRRTTVAGVDIESRTIPTMKESEHIFRANEYDKNKYRDGVTLDGQGIAGARLVLFQAVSTLFPLDLAAQGGFWREAAGKRAKTTPAYALIISRTNYREDQVAAGRLYARLQLAATKQGIATHPQSQVLQEFKEMAALYKKIHEEFSSNGRVIQMLVRMGKSGTTTGHSPRRDVRTLFQAGTP